MKSWGLDNPMGEIILFTLKKYGMEIIFASVLIDIWGILFYSRSTNLDLNIFNGIYVVFLGTLMTGYAVILMLSSVGVVIARLKHPGDKLVISWISAFYVSTYYIFSPKNEITTPIFIGILLVNLAIVSVTLFCSKSR